MNTEAMKLSCSAPQAAAHAEIIHCLAQPDIVGALKASSTFGPIVTEILALLQAGVNTLPAILAALAASGIVLPAWVTLIVNLLLAILPKPTA
jgi:hypothetical protein